MHKFIHPPILNGFRGGLFSVSWGQNVLYLLNLMGGVWINVKWGQWWDLQQLKVLQQCFPLTGRWRAVWQMYASGGKDKGPLSLSGIALRPTRGLLSSATDQRKSLTDVYWTAIAETVFLQKSKSNTGIGSDPCCCCCNKVFLFLFIKVTDATQGSGWMSVISYP